MNFVPHEYQKQAISWLVQRPEAALFLEPGLGKTSCVLTAFQALRAAGAVRKMLIVAPLRVCEMVWSRSGELGKWEDFHDLTVALVHGSDKAAALAREADLYVINFDGLPWLCEGDRLAGLVRRGVDVLVMDELSKLKHTNTDEIIEALETGLSSDEPLIVNVDEGEEGERVQVYIG